MYFRHYETVTIVDADAGQEGYDKVLTRMREALEKTDGREIRLEDWGRRRLAYDLRNKNRAHYLYLNYLGTNTTVAELERLLKISEPALKWQTIVLADQILEDEFDFESEAKDQTEMARGEGTVTSPDFDRDEDEDDDEDDDEEEEE